MDNMSNIKAESKYDLTSKLAEYMDPHLIVELIKNADMQNIYSKSTLNQAMLQVVSKTQLFGDVKDCMNANVFGTMAGTMERMGKGSSIQDGDMILEKREKVAERHAQWQQQCEPIISLLAEKDLETINKETNHSMELLERNYNITSSMLQQYYAYSKSLYESGEYEMATNQLTNYLNLTASQQQQIAFNAMWGKLAGLILQGKFKEAQETIMKLKEDIDIRKSSSLEQLQQRTWLLHWSLFVFFNLGDEGRTDFVDFCFQKDNMQAIQTNCPWMLRYLTTAVIFNKSKRNKLEELVNVIELEQFSYADPITQFLQCLYVDFDFDGAQEKLIECQKVMRTDYFLVPICNEFVEHARSFMFETYCRIHKKIDITTLAEKLAMTSEDAEKWIVELIRDTYLDARIDSQHNYVVMNSVNPSIYKQVMDRTKDLTQRSLQIAKKIDSIKKKKKADSRMNSSSYDN